MPEIVSEWVVLKFVSEGPFVLMAVLEPKNIREVASLFVAQVIVTNVQALALRTGFAMTAFSWPV